ncbi:MAG: SURF1 family protein [Pseudomonadales bacterium]|nr:SURF1 family protein [Pseudomonadales bacterium]
MNERARRPWTLRPSRRLTAFVLLFLPVLLGLGAWQLRRAEEKTAVEARAAERAAQPPRPIDELPQPVPAELDLLRVQLEGTVLRERVLLLDNRTWQGRPGYEVWAPVVHAPERAVLVNFGWLEAPRTRAELPEPALPPGRIRLTGRLLLADDGPPVFGETEEAGWPRRVQRVDPVAQDRLFPSVALAPFRVVADPDAPGVATWTWAPVRMSADRHRAYAVQWFGLASVLVLGWLAASLRRGHAGDEEEESE